MNRLSVVILLHKGIEGCYQLRDFINRNADHTFGCITIIIADMGNRPDKLAHVSNIFFGEERTKRSKHNFLR